MNGNVGNAHLMINTSCGEDCGEVVRTVLLDDLLPFLLHASEERRPKAIVKNDIEGHQVQAFDSRTSSTFFDHVDVRAIYFEWHPRTPTFTNDGGVIVSVQANVERMVDFLRHQGYVDRDGKDIGRISEPDSTTLS